MDRVTHALRNSSRWLLLGALVYAPWAHGCTTSETIAILNQMLAAVLLVWVADLLLSRRLPTVPLPLLVIAAALLGIGWWMVINAPTIYDSDLFVFMPRSHPFPRLPGSVDEQVSAAWMVRATLLLGIACFVADLSLRPIWLMRLWATISVAGGSLALLGLLQKASGAEMVFWGEAPAAPFKTFFASYYYHGNAGAYINLALPPAVGLGIRVLTRPASPIARALWPACAFCLVLAVFANTSRVAQILGLGLMIVIALLWLRGRARISTRAEIFAILAGAAVVIVSAIAVAQASHLDQPLERWGELRRQLPADSRWLASQAAWRGASDAGWFGLGPGTFRVVFPYFTAYLGDKASGVWRFLHEDYLQTLLEWGRVGAALWSALLFGGIAIAVRNLRSGRAARWIPRRRIVLPLVVMALIATAVHAVVDFPLQIASIQLYGRRISESAGAVRAGRRNREPTSNWRMGATQGRDGESGTTARKRPIQENLARRLSAALLLGRTRRVRTFASTITMRSVVVVVACTSGPRKPIQDDAGGTDAGGSDHSEGALHRVPNGVPCADDDANTLHVRSHQQRVADGKNRSAVDDDAIVETRGFGDECGEPRSAEKLGRVRSAGASG